MAQNLKLTKSDKSAPTSVPCCHTILGSHNTDSSSKVNLQVKHVRRFLCAWVWEICEEMMLTTVSRFASLGRTLEVWVQLGSNWSCWHVAALEGWLYKAKLLCFCKKEIQKHKSKTLSQWLCNLIYVGVWCPEPSGRRTRGVALVLGIQWWDAKTFQRPPGIVTATGWRNIPRYDIYMGMALKTLWIVPRWSGRLERGDYVKGHDPEVSKPPNDMTWNVAWPKVTWKGGEIWNRSSKFHGLWINSLKQGRKPNNHKFLHGDTRSWLWSGSGLDRSGSGSGSAWA